MEQMSWNGLMSRAIYSPHCSSVSIACLPAGRRETTPSQSHPMRRGLQTNLKGGTSSFLRNGTDHFPLGDLLFPLCQLLIRLIKTTIGELKEFTGIFRIMNSIPLLGQLVIKLRLSIEFSEDKGMASSFLHFFDLFLNLVQFGSHFFQQFLTGRLPADSHLPIAWVMAFNATFLNRIEGIFLL